MQNRSARTSLSLFLSTALHASTIALIALGPSYMPGLNGQGDNQSSAVEFVVSESSGAPSVPVVATTAPPSLAVTTVPTQAPVPTPTSELKAESKNEAPVIIKKPTSAPKKTAKAEPLPEKSAEPVVATEKPSVIETPSPAEETPVAEETLVTQESPVVVESTDTEEPSAVEKSPVAADAKVNEEQNDEKEELIAAEESPAPAKEEIIDPAKEEIAEEAMKPVVATTTAETTTPPAQAANQSQAGTGHDAHNGAPSGQSQTLQVTQNYLGLRQLPGNKPPSYTREMRFQKLQGRGQLVYFVTKDGRVSHVRLTRSTGSPALDQAAVDAFSKYRFVPGQEGYTLHDFEFSLTGPAEVDKARLRTTMNR